MTCSYRQLLLTLVLVLCTVPVSAATLKVRADSWPPYNDDPSAAAPGYMIEVLQEIYSPLGATIDYRLMPWVRAVSDVQGGSADILIGTDHGESPRLVFPKEPVGENLNGFFVTADNPWRFHGVESLVSLRLGVIDGYSYSEKIDAYIAGSNGSGRIFLATGDGALDKLLKMLQSGRIDAIIENVNVMSYTLRSKALGQKVVLAGADEEGRMPLFVAFSPHHPEARSLARSFDDGIHRLRESGRLQKILARYGLIDWK